MNPIPLRTITILLNYERMVTDPRFKDVKLINTSVANPALIQTIRSIPANSKLFLKVPNTIIRTDFHLFAKDTQDTTLQPASTICEIHPNATPEIKTLNRDQLELIYHVTRGNSGCYKAIAMYQCFFEQCPAGQQLSIQFRDEPPILVDIGHRRIFEMTVQGPRLHMIASGLQMGVGLSTVTGGDEEDRKHSVLGFANPADPGSLKNYIVVDMARMQYGEAGRGTLGESYYLGTWGNFAGSMQKICDGVTPFGNLGTLLNLENLYIGADNMERLAAGARRVWERLQNRAVEGWCAYCGKPDSHGTMNCCGGCEKAKVKYCCRDHQVADRKLHKYTCENAKKVKK